VKRFLWIILAGIFYTSVGVAADFSVLSSGKEISIGVWSDSATTKRTGGYANFFLDFDEYQDGSIVSVCGDGSISGSFGSGTCSGHSGVSGTKEAIFGRWGFVIGGSVWVSNFFQVHSGLVWARYYSDIDIGEMGALDYDEFGLDLGVSLRHSRTANYKIMASYETEQKRTLLGVRFRFM